MSPRKGRASRGRPRRSAAARLGADLGARIALAALAGVLVGTALLVDRTAEAAFDAPKRLAALVGIVVAAVALLVIPRQTSEAAWSWRTLSPEQRLVVILAAVAVASALASTALSARPGVSIDTMRVGLLFALLLPLGASRALDAGRSSILAGVFLGASLINAVASALQSSGMKLFAVRTVGGRFDVSAFVGNDGVLALALALAAVIAGGLVLLVRSPRVRLAAGGGLLLFLVGLALNQSLTALIAGGAGAVVLVVSVRRWRVVAGAAGVAAILALALALHPASAARAREAASAVRAGEWDRVLTYRLGPWAAALEMVRARPLAGVGPGAFAAEFVPHRLRAELRDQRRFVNPSLAGSYGEAHSEYVQAFAEIGVPGALAALAAAGVLGAGLLRALRRSDDDRARREAVVLLALLCAGAAAALTWFPFQRPITAVPLLLAAGRAWTLSGAGQLGDDA